MTERPDQMTTHLGDGGDGVEMPMLGFGTWRLRGSQCYDAVLHALRVGYRHIDTAAAYGNEREVGRALRDSDVPREQVFVTTKLPAEEAGREREVITESLEALGLDDVDLWLVHWPPDGQARPDTWRRLVEVRADGLTKTIGVSNYSLDQIDELIDATGETPAVNQVRWAPTHRDPSLAAGLADRGVVLEGYSPLRSGDLDDPVLTKIADAHQVSTAQVVLRWHLDTGVVVIPKSATPARIESNFDIFGFSLTDDEIAAIDGLADAVRR